MPKHRDQKNGLRKRTGASRASVGGAACPYCGKRCYASRKWAKRGCRILYPGARMSAYKCIKVPDDVDAGKFWHVGHLAEPVIRRNVARSTVYRQPDLSPGRPERRGPIPPGLRATVTKRDKDKDNDGGKSDGTPGS